MLSNKSHFPFVSLEMFGICYDLAIEEDRNRLHNVCNDKKTWLLAWGNGGITSPKKAQGPEPALPAEWWPHETSLQVLIWCGPRGDWRSGPGSCEAPLFFFFYQVLLGLLPHSHSQCVCMVCAAHTTQKKLNTGFNWRLNLSDSKLYRKWRTPFHRTLHLWLY